MSKNYIYIGGGILIVLLLITGYSLFRGGSSGQQTTGRGNFGTGENRDVTVTSPDGAATNPEGQGITYGSGGTTQNVFKINDGPVMGATLMQYGRPTTTVARFVMQDSGHVFDLPLDSPGSVARAVSNTTIPGLSTAAFSERGNGLILQYLDNEVVKTVHLAFPAATTTITTSGPVKLQFFPNGIRQVAVSPDGTSAAYLVPTTAGSDGYVAKADGTLGKKLFNLPLSQLLLSWPSAGTMLAQSTSAAGVPGVVFSVDAKSGSAVPLIYAPGITATADKDFSHVIYQTVNLGSRSAYTRDVKNGINTQLVFTPSPEKCAWSSGSASTMYCAASVTYVEPNFLDLWHQGTASAADTVFKFDVLTGAAQLLAAPGSKDGGEQSDIAELAVSPDDKYLLFIRKGDRSLWGVRLTQ
jgi:hypothetical protein